MKRKLTAVLCALATAITTVVSASAATLGRIDAAAHIIWKASAADASKQKGDALDKDGNLTIGWTPDKSGDTNVTIGGVTFNYYITHSSENGAWSSSEKGATGTNLKFTAPSDGVFTAYITNFNSVKTFYISEGGGTRAKVIDSVTGSEAGYSCCMSVNVEAGKVYYAYVQGSKGSFVGAAFEPDAKIEPEVNLLENPGFETGELAPFNRRSSNCAVTTDKPHDGAYCASVTRRTDAWTGIEYDIKGLIEENAVYRAAAWIRLSDTAADGTDSNFYLQVEIRETGRDSTYPVIANVTAKKGEWIKLSGLFTLDGYTYPLDRAYLYICSADTNKSDFYVDDFELVKTNASISQNPPITEFPTQDNPVTEFNADVDFGEEYQTIEGFGASGAFGAAAAIQNLPSDKRDDAMTLLFDKDNGIGLTVVRNMLTPAIGENEGEINLSADSAQGWLMKESVKYGAKRIMTTCWTPPAYMKDNNSTMHGSLAADRYADFANYLADYIEAYKAQGVDIDVISPCNEPDLSPDYDGCTWTPEALADFVKTYLKPTLTERGLRTRVLAAEEMRYSEDKIGSILSDPKALWSTDIIGVHGYGADSYDPLQNVKNAGKSVWMTEIMGYNSRDDSITDGLLWAKRIHQIVAQCGASEWNFWYLAHQYDGGNSALLVTDKYNEDFIAAKRLYTIGNYSKFVRPGARLVKSSLVPNSDVYLSAYKNENGAQVIVAVNANTNAQTANLTLKHSSGRTFDIYRTSETENLENKGVITAENGVMTAELPARSVTTFVTAPAQTDELFCHTFSGGGAPFVYETYSGTGALSTKSGTLLADFGNDWDGGNGIRLDVTDYVSGTDRRMFTASAELIRDNYYDTDAELFFEMIGADGAAEKIPLDKKQGTVNAPAVFSGTAYIPEPNGGRVYLCMTHPTGYQQYDNITLSFAEEEIEYEITSYLSGTAVITAPEECDAAVIFAEYGADGSLIKTDIVPARLAIGENTVTSDAVTADSNVSVMLWSSVEGMKPICAKR